MLTELGWDFVFMVLQILHAGLFLQLPFESELCVLFNRNLT